jgi:hypothetical protein
MFALTLLPWTLSAVVFKTGAGVQDGLTRSVAVLLPRPSLVVVVVAALRYAVASRVANAVYGPAHRR